MTGSEPPPPRPAEEHHTARYQTVKALQLGEIPVVIADESRQAKFLRWLPTLLQAILVYAFAPDALTRRSGRLVGEDPATRPADSAASLGFRPMAPAAEVAQLVLQVVEPVKPP